MMPLENIAPIKERRQKPRLYQSFPIKVQGVDSAETEFEISTVLDNISAAGLYFRLTRSIDTGVLLSIIVTLSHSTDKTASGIRIATRGKVVRVEELPRGEYGIAVTFKSRKYL